jgi:hypothetical protein
MDGYDVIVIGTGTAAQVTLTRRCQILELAAPRYPIPSRKVNLP